MSNKRYKTGSRDVFKDAPAEHTLQRLNSSKRIEFYRILRKPEEMVKR